MKNVTTTSTGYVHISGTIIIGRIRCGLSHGRRELQHLTTGEILRVENPIHAVELATLVQSKVHEPTASGIGVHERGSCWEL